jgi:hypothetical protein
MSTFVLTQAEAGSNDNTPTSKQEGRGSRGDAKLRWVNYYTYTVWIFKISLCFKCFGCYYALMRGALKEI